MKRRELDYKNICEELKRLEDVADLKELIKTIEHRISALETTQNIQSVNSVQIAKVATGHYALELVKCGKRGCKCSSGKKEDLHGPYWYHYRYIGGGKFTPRYKKSYYGKEFPPLQLKT